MRYNTSRKPLIFSEYGRGIQDMVDHAVEIPDKKSRNRAAQTIVRYMLSLHPQIRETDDYMHRLYDQLIIMSDFKLDIDNPYPAPQRNGAAREVKPFQYRTSMIRFRYYGRTLETMIRKATEMPEGDEKNMFLNLITVQMKKSYYLWNADILTDEMVAEHLSVLSDGKLKYTDAMKGEVYSTFYNKPSLEHKSKYINVSAYENTGRRQNFTNRNSNNNKPRYSNNNNRNFSQNTPNRHDKKRRSF